MNADEKKEAAKKYLPIFYQDSKEPFEIQGIGYTVFEQEEKSPSCQRVIAPRGAGGCVIEYAVYWDFDIQHLYDLEHVHVYIGADGEIQNVEGSFHGFFFNNMINGDLQLEGTRPVLYLQPGKHAVMPDPKYYALYRDYDAACNRLSGVDGFLVCDFLQEVFQKSTETDAQVTRYIQENYAFTPGGSFVRNGQETAEMLMPFEELRRQMIVGLSAWLDRICHK